MPDSHPFEEPEAPEAPESPQLEQPEPFEEREDENDLNNTAFAFVFGAVLAIIPLSLWAGVSVWMMIQVLRPGRCVLGIDNGEDVNYDNNNTTTGETFNSCEMGGVPLSVYDACFGMVTALIVAELAITPTGKDPSERLTLGAEKAFRRVACGQLWQCMITWLPACYMFVWFMVGLTSLIVGGFIMEDEAGPLRATGMMWFGAIISSAYSYFWLAGGGRHRG